MRKRLKAPAGCYISVELPQDSMGIQGRTRGGGVSLRFKGAQHMARVGVGVGGRGAEELLCRWGVGKMEESHALESGL